MNQEDLKSMRTIVIGGGTLSPEQVLELITIAEQQHADVCVAGHVRQSAAGFYHFEAAVEWDTLGANTPLYTVAPADCTSCDGIGDRIALRRDGADVSKCDTCKGTGQQCVGYSGLAEDGNGPVMDPCGECGYGADLPEEVLFTEAWKRRFQYSPTYQFFDTRGGWLTPKDDPVHMGWVGWQLARASGLPAGAAPAIDWPAASDWWSNKHIDLGLDQDEAFMRRVDLLIQEPHLPELRKSALVNRLSELARPAIRGFYEQGYKAGYAKAKADTIATVDVTA